MQSLDSFWKQKYIFNNELFKTAFKPNRRVLKQSLKATYFPLSNIHIFLWLSAGNENKSLCL